MDSILTPHARVRMQQRGIRPEMLDALLDFGREVHVPGGRDLVFFDKQARARLAKAGYFIRTRADSGLRAEAPGQPARRDAALASGAHIISSDFPPGESDAKTGYVVAFPDSAAARVNPINAPEALRGKTVPE